MLLAGLISFAINYIGGRHLALLKGGPHVYRGNIQITTVRRFARIEIVTNRAESAFA